MAKLEILKATTDITLYVFIQDSSQSDGSGLTGLVFNSAGLSCYYVRPLGNAAQLTLATQTVTGAHSDGGFVEVSGANMPGVYRLDLSDAICATGVNSVVVMLKGATNMAPVVLEIQLVSFDPNDSTPGVNVTQWVGDNVSSPTNPGIPVVNTAYWDGTVVAIPTVAGVPEVRTQLMAPGVITATAIDTDAIDADAIADNAITAGAIAADAITAAKIADGAIDAATFAAGAITATVIATGAIDADAIADNAIDAGAIANDAITAAKIATGAIDADAIADNAIDAGAIAADAITAAKIATGAIDADALAADAVQEIWTSTLTEAYAADGAAATGAQLLYMLLSALAEFSISGTTITCKKIDGSTTAMEFTLDDATNPTSRTRSA